MEIVKDINGSNMNISLSGRLDTSTSPQLDEELKASLDGISALTIDMTALDYLSSAGLRVLLATQKRMNAQGSMVVKNVNSTIMEVFELTGFSEILTIE